MWIYIMRMYSHGSGKRVFARCFCLLVRTPLIFASDPTCEEQGLPSICMQKRQEIIITILCYSPHAIFQESIHVYSYLQLVDITLLCRFRAPPDLGCSMGSLWCTLGGVITGAGAVTPGPLNSFRGLYDRPSTLELSIITMSSWCALRAFFRMQRDTVIQV